MFDANAAHYTSNYVPKPDIRKRENVRDRVKVLISGCLLALASGHVDAGKAEMEISYLPLAKPVNNNRHSPFT